MKKINNIIWFVSDFKEAGGGERFILEAQHILRKKNVRINIICRQYDKKVLYNFFSENELYITCLNPIQLNIRGVIGKFINYCFCIKSLRNQFKTIKPDNIVSQNIADHVIVYLASLFFSFPHIIKDDGPLFQISGQNIIYSILYRNKLNKILNLIKDTGESIQTVTKTKFIFLNIFNEIKGLLLYMSFKNAFIILSLTEKVKNEVKILYRHKNIYKIRGAYSKAIFNYAPRTNIRKRLNLLDKKIIFNIGRLVKHKRVDLCIKAINIIKNKNSDVKLLIGGIGPESDDLKNLVKSLKLEDYVEFLGFIEETELLDYYYACDVFTTMDSADFDITPYVALALEKNVVWPKIMGLDRELEENNRHIFSTVPNPTDIANSYYMALNSPVKGNSVTESNDLQNYTWDSCFGNMLKVMEGKI